MLESYEKIEDIGKGKFYPLWLGFKTSYETLHTIKWGNTLYIGSFGRVSKVRHKNDGRILVWKELNYGKMNEKEKQQIVAEVNILKELQHPNIVRYFERVIDKKNLKLYIIMEYCQGGDLQQIIKRCIRAND